VFQFKPVVTTIPVAPFAGEDSVGAAGGAATVVNDQMGDAACLLLLFGSMLVTYQ
jgi:hypothetical protein